MEKTRFIYLHQEYIKQTITAEEWDEFKNLLNDGANEKLFAEVLDGNWNSISTEEIAALDSDRFESIYSVIIQTPQYKGKVFSFWYKSIAAAAAVLLIAGAGLFYYNYHHQENQGVQFTADIAPREKGATLTLSNGRKIKLTNDLQGLLAKESGVSITKNRNGQIVYNLTGSEENFRNGSNTLATDTGETFVLTLPDQTKVWLNAGSSITYPISFNGYQKRIVRLKGEAYFEVHKDKLHPFVVQSKSQQVEVLGTHFNINAYTGESAIKTTLIEGSVKVTQVPLNSMGSSGTTQSPVILKPQEQALVTDNTIEKAIVDTVGVLGWLHGKIIFRDESLTSIMREVSLWYGVDVVYEGDVSELNYWGAVSRTTNLSSVLEYFSKTGNVRFKIQGKKVTVIKKNRN
jgi:transmembrane sensor